ncbi:MAG: hypothetical protein NTW21_44215, partial [Verrucomicrobia bacterium]|nr:hypothetical protein [Verrucomicrobiota bacterium]
DKDTLELPLPAEFAKANVLVEIVAAGQRKAQAYHANTLKLTLTENYGRLETRDSASNRAVSKAYVKVYARLGNGTVRFFKDGYTDLRGRFDYASLNGGAPGQPVPVPLPQPRSGRLPRRRTASTIRCSSPPSCRRSRNSPSSSSARPTVPPPAKSPRLASDCGCRRVAAASSRRPWLRASGRIADGSKIPDGMLPESSTCSPPIARGEVPHDLILIPRLVNHALHAAPTSALSPRQRRSSRSAGIASA